MFVPLTPPSVIWLPSCEGVLSCLTGSVVSVDIAECIALLSNEPERACVERSFSCLIETLPRHFTLRDWGKPQKTSARSEPRTFHCRYASLFGLLSMSRSALPVFHNGSLAAVMDR